MIKNLEKELTNENLKQELDYYLLPSLQIDPPNIIKNISNPNNNIVFNNRIQSHLQMDKFIKKSEEKDLFSNDLLKNLDDPSPRPFLIHKDSNEVISMEETIESNKYDDKIDCSKNYLKNNHLNEKPNRDKIDEFSNNNCKIFNFNENLPNKPLNERNFYRKNSISSEYLNSNFMIDIRFNQLAFSPTHFTPNFYEEMRENQKYHKISQFPFKINENSCNGFSISNYKNQDENVKMMENDKINRNKVFKLENIKDIKKPKKFSEREGDWVCIVCKNLNFKFRVQCNICKLPKEISKKLFEKYLENIALYSKLNNNLQNYYTNFNSNYQNDIRCNNQMFNYNLN